MLKNHSVSTTKCTNRGCIPLPQGIIHSASLRFAMKSQNMISPLVNLLRKLGLASISQAKEATLPTTTSIYSPYNKRTYAHTTLDTLPADIKLILLEQTQSFQELLNLSSVSKNFLSIYESYDTTLLRGMLERQAGKKYMRVALFLGNVTLASIGTGKLDRNGNPLPSLLDIMEDGRDGEVDHELLWASVDGWLRGLCDWDLEDRSSAKAPTVLELENAILAVEKVQFIKIYSRDVDGRAWKDRRSYQKSILCDPEEEESDTEFLSRDWDMDVYFMAGLMLNFGNWIATYEEDNLMFLTQHIMWSILMDEPPNLFDHWLSLLRIWNDDWEARNPTMRAADFVMRFILSEESRKWLAGTDEIIQWLGKVKDDEAGQEAKHKAILHINEVSELEDLESGTKASKTSPDMLECTFRLLFVSAFRRQMKSHGDARIQAWFANRLSELRTNESKFRNFNLFTD